MQISAVKCSEERDNICFHRGKKRERFFFRRAITSKERFKSSSAAKRLRLPLLPLSLSLEEREREISTFHCGFLLVWEGKGGEAEEIGDKS